MKPRSSAPSSSVRACSDSSNSCIWFCVNFSSASLDVAALSIFRTVGRISSTGQGLRQPLTPSLLPQTPTRYFLFRDCGLFGLSTRRKVEFDLPLFVQDEPCAERFAGARAEAGNHLVRATVLDQLARDLGGDRPPRDALPDHVAAAGLLAALPARAAVGAGVLLDDLARLGA